MEVFINGKKYKAACDPNTRLSTFIRDHVGLKGTKVMCNEGGCGVCIVTVSRQHPITGDESTEAINSCLCPLYTVAGCHVTTVEGLGSKRSGFHKIQKNIAEYNGSQCGYCTPGMVMNMYGNTSSPVDKAKIEKSFDGVLCRCTGYRSILDSAKAFTDQPVLDIEELCKFKCKTEAPFTRKIDWDERVWLSPTSMDEFLQVFKDYSGKSMELVFGNTSKGIYKNYDNKELYIYLRYIKELYQFEVCKDGIRVGSNISIQTLINKLEEVAQNPASPLHRNYLHIFNSFLEQLKNTGGLAVRNAASWAGNLMLKHKDNSFPSDLFTPLEALQAIIHVADENGTKEYTAAELLSVNMQNKIVTAMTLPPTNPVTERFLAFKVAPRVAQSKAHLNASFYVKFQGQNSRTIQDVRIVYGGLSSKFVRARNTEQFLINKTLSKNVFKEACSHLVEEFIVEENQLSTSKNYRISVAQNMMYLFLKNACDSNISSDQFYTQMKNVRPASSATYEFENKEEKYPYCQPMPKLDSILQASGEAEYTGDRPPAVGELHAVCVLSEYARAKITGIDDSKALEIEGVQSVITSSNMLGKNSVESQHSIEPLLILANGETLFAGQPIAIVLADSLSAAMKGAKAVKVSYSGMQAPILHLEQAIEKGYSHAKLPKFNYDVTQGDAIQKLSSCSTVIEGSVQTESQYHFYMENNVCIVTPYDDMLDIQCTSQVLGPVQNVASQITNKSHASINVKTLRLGGGFGGKGALSEFIAPALAVIAAHTANKPVRLHTTLEQCMKMNGKRYPMLAKYKVGVSAENNIQCIVMDIYQDCGSRPTSVAHGLLERGIKSIDNAYRIPDWKITGHPMKTDRPMAFAMRAPDTLQLAFIMESIMEQVATEIHHDPILFKEIHLIGNGDLCLRGEPYVDATIQNIWSELKQWMDLKGRLEEINQFNQSNRFLKRGLAITPTRFPISYSAYCTYNVYITVYAVDGTVAISHGCIEMGQGLNTKVIQVAAQYLGIDVNCIKVHSTATLTSANNAGTFGSQGSDNVCRSTLEACKLLKKKMYPFQNEQCNLPWNDLVTKCNVDGLDMSVSYRHNKGNNHRGKYAYCVYSACAVEVEVNVLTGENSILRLDGIFDVGESANPTIDVGQIEGSVMMGLGFFRSEREIYDRETGRLLTSGTWEYKPPSALDVPLKMNIKLMKNNYNELGVMPSKATGEPPMLTSCAVMFAIRSAIQSYRNSTSNHKNFILNQPATVESIQQMCEVQVDHLVDAL